MAASPCWHGRCNRLLLGRGMKRGNDLPEGPHLISQHSPLELALPIQAHAWLSSGRAREGEPVMFWASCSQWCIEAHQERIRR
ncbi:hypothetical protein Y1Q_0006082 [Alligator mississippiensis]|uniref:Uncharacterized protein n=1 Tax=Alligator mississippiensis TaxID=8496 RepID=A0A151N4J2_ALLMI|nr:hypothetical protein Y1Q_0006082 [Alligator mississippiensis]